MDRSPLTESSPAPPTVGERIKVQVDRFLQRPSTEVGILFLIFLSVLMMVLEMTVKTPRVRSVLLIGGDSLTVFFAVELVVRYWVARKKSRFFRRYWLDILAVAPMIRPLRFFRVLRVLRIFRAGVLMNRRLSLFKAMVSGTANELVALAAVSSTIVLAAAMTVHLSEGPSNAAFATFDQSVWFAVLSLIAGEPVGGVPDTELGRWTTLLLMVGGLTVFGMFVGTVSASMVSRLSSRLELHEMDLEELEGHVLVCGWNRSGPTVVQELFGPGTPPARAVVVITEDPRPADLPTDGVRPELLYHLRGDYTRADLLEQAGVMSASCAILLTDTVIPRSDQDRDARTVLAALTIERLVPHIYTIAELTNRENQKLLEFAGVEEIVVGNWYAGVILGSASRNPGLVTALDEILTTESGNAFYTMEVPRTWSGRSIADLHNSLLVEFGAVLISYERGRVGGKRGRVLVNPPAELVVAEGDTLMVLSRREVRT